MSNAQDTKVMSITPQMAERFLRRHEALVANDPANRNRRLKPGVVEKYARMMRDGHWQLNGETIKLASNGRILDGQHRLAACVKAGVAFRTHVVQNVQHEAMQTIDTGVLRYGGDLFTIAGEANSHVLAVACGVVWRWEQAGEARTIDWKKAPHRSELFDVLERHPGIRDYSRRVTTFAPLVSSGLVAALWYLFARRDSILADAFFDALKTGANLKEDDPVWVLRERLIRDRGEKAGGRDRMERTADLIIRAWNHTRQGSRIAKMQKGRSATSTLGRV